MRDCGCLEIFHPADLIKRLLEYQKYRAAAEELGRHDILDRDVFARRARVAALRNRAVFEVADLLEELLAASHEPFAQTQPDWVGIG